VSSAIGRVPTGKAQQQGRRFLRVDR
jgi:hypothetical protein